MYKHFFINENKNIKEYIAIAISLLAIIVSIISMTISFKQYNEFVRAEERKQAEEREKVEKLEKIKAEKLEKIKAEDAKLGLISTAQKERDNLIYNKNVQAEIDKILSSKKKEVYLTFDDGPSKHTNALLDVLKEADVKATFFILGTNIKGREKELKRIYNEGHTVANHSYTHKYADIYKTPEATYKEYTKTENALKKVLGSDFNSNLFRFPGGSVGGYYEAQKKKCRAYFTKKKIAFIDWNSLTDDSVGADTTKKQLKVFNATRKKKKALIVLQHDSYTSTKTAATVKLMIEQLKKEEYVFKNFNDILVKEDKVKEIEDTIKDVENNIENNVEKIQNNTNNINTTFI